MALGMMLMRDVNSLISQGGGYTGWINAIIWIAIFIIGTGTLLDFLFTNRKPKTAFTNWARDLAGKKSLRIQILPMMDNRTFMMYNPVFDSLNKLKRR